MTGTPSMTFLGPSNLDDYKPELPSSQQPSTIPRIFLDAMEVREAVFVKEQGVPLANEFDSDDARSCHWVVYASANEVTEPEETDTDIVKPKESGTKTRPIGTIRLVPFPHGPHPEPGAVYTFEPTTAPYPPPPYIIDRATTYHDGKELYIKLGRIAVLPEFRGHKIANLLVSTALTWAQRNPSSFNPTVEKYGVEKLGSVDAGEVPEWKGLVCVHAQEQVAKAWSKWGFKVDDGMGMWDEEGIMHVGMFQRLKL